MPSTTPDDAATPTTSSGSGLSQDATRSWVMPHSMRTAGSLSASGTGPSAGGGDQSLSTSIIALRSAMIGWKCPAPSGGVPAAQASDDVGERLVDLGVVQVEHVVGLGEHALRGEQRAERLHLLEEPGGEPVLAVELVVLDEREHQAAQAEHLVEGGLLVVGAEQVAVAAGDPLALGDELLGRPRRDTAGPTAAT